MIVRAYSNRKGNTEDHKAGRAAAENIPHWKVSIAEEIRRQRQGLKGKADASRLPSFSGEYEQLDPGRKDGSIKDPEEDGENQGSYHDSRIWDKHFKATRSSNVQEIFYSSERKILRAVFLPRKTKSGKEYPAAQYIYLNVPPQVFTRLEYMERSGGSVGSEFWKIMRIKPHAHRYHYRKIVGEGLGGNDGNIDTIYGVYSEYGMPELVGDKSTPIYDWRTKKNMRRAKKRAEARSARSSTATGGSARSRKRR